MKNILITLALLLMAHLTGSAQNIINPKFDDANDKSTTISRITTDDLYTAVTFKHNGASSWIQVNKDMYIKTLDGTHYDFVKADNIAVASGRSYIEDHSKPFIFTVYFNKIPPTAKYIDIIEREVMAATTNTFLNFYNVSLTESRPVKDIVEVKPTPLGVSFSTGEKNEMAGIMDSFGPMFRNMTKSVMDAQLNYYKQPGKIAEIAKLNKQYYDALMKEGFTADQALKIITSDGILPKASGTGNK